MSKKLVIRINNLQDIETSDDYEVAEETSIRWDRVISAAVVAVLLLVALVWGAWYFLSTEEPGRETKILDVISEPVAKDMDLPEVSTDVEKTVEKTNIISNDHLESAPQTIVVDKPQTVAADTPSVKVEMAPVVKNPVASVEAKNSDESAVLTVEAAPIAAAVFVDPIVIESSRIVKAQLTHGVNNSEPVDQLGNVVSMNADTLIKVYLFTSMEGLKGETLYHDWYLSGKKMARVKIKVRSDKTSASSSKFIDQYMVGDWQVQVSTSRGDELVSARFNVIP